MSPLRIEYSEHAVQEMRKARLSRRTVRLVVQYGLREFEMERRGELHYRSTLSIEHQTYRVQWIQQPGRVYVVTVYRVGEYD